MAVWNINPLSLVRESARSRRKSLAALACVIVVSLTLLWWPARSRPARTWLASEVPIAFWAWRSAAPNDEDLQRAISETQAQSLFLRAGQIDYEGGELRRIRAVTGTLPQKIEIHLVYNATRSCLAAFEKLDANDLALAISGAYAEDVARAARDGASVQGVQLDIDVPTRLLAGYERILRAVRASLPQGTRLSITGLLTWMDSPALKSTLSAVDFWMPQCYGATIPESLNRSISISSPSVVSRAIARVRALDRPFYAGLSAYGYAIHYARNGSLVTLRGDMNPSLVAANSNFELVERRPFDETGECGDQPAIASEWRYVYRARSDCIVDGVWVKAGESMMLDMSSVASLRESAREVREQAGDLLLGICVFRLPMQGDPTTLTIREIACALSGAYPFASNDVEIKNDDTLDEKSDHQNHSLLVTISNEGTASSLLGDDAMRLTLRLPRGSVREISLRGFDSSGLLCEAPVKDGGNRNGRAQDCGARRANLLSLSKSFWPPGAKATARIEFKGKPPQSIDVEFSMRVDDGSEVSEKRTIEVKDRSAR